MLDETQPHDGATEAPGERACPSCGAANPVAATFCWQCFATLGGRVGFPVPQPFPSAPQTAEARSIWPRVLVGFVATAVTAALAVFLVGRLGGGVEFPESIAGIQRVHSKVLDAAVEQVKEQQGADGMDLDMAVYGSDIAPRLLVFWVRDPHDADPEQAFRLFSQGVSSSGSAAIDTTRMTTESVDGTDYVCAPVTGLLQADLCFWHDGDIYWILMDLNSSGLEGARELSHETMVAVG